MASIEETPAVDAPKTEQDPMVAAVEALNLEYNKSVETLSVSEEAVQSAQSTVFKLLLDVSKKTATAGLDQSTLGTTSFTEVHNEYLSLKEDVYGKQTASFRLLQKLRLSHTNYLMAVITTLQKELAEAKK